MVFNGLVDRATDISVGSSDILPTLYILAAVSCVILFKLNKNVEVVITRERRMSSLNTQDYAQILTSPSASLPCQMRFGEKGGHGQFALLA